MEERITKEELLERLFHDDYENLKGRRLRLTRVRVPGKELSFAHVFTPNDRSIYENLALHIGVHEGEDHSGDAIGMVRVTPWEAIVVAADVAVNMFLEKYRNVNTSCEMPPFFAIKSITPHNSNIRLVQSPSHKMESLFFL